MEALYSYPWDYENEVQHHRCYKGPFFTPADPCTGLCVVCTSIGDDIDQLHSASLYSRPLHQGGGMMNLLPQLFSGQLCGKALGWVISVIGTMLPPMDAHAVQSL